MDEFGNNTWCGKQSKDDESAPKCGLQPGHEGECDEIDGFLLSVQTSTLQLGGRVMFRCADDLLAWVDERLPLRKFEFDKDELGPRRYATFSLNESLMVTVVPWRDYIVDKQRAASRQAEMQAAQLAAMQGGRPVGPGPRRMR